MTVAFPLVDDPSTSLLAWTTTPWTLPSNLGLCVHPDFTYVKIHDIARDQNFILLESLLSTVYKGYDPKKKPDPKKKEEPKFKIIGSFQGTDMVGWRYVPMFDYFTEQVGGHILDYADGDSTRTELSVSCPTTTSRPTLVLVSYTRLRPLVKTITELLLPTRSFAKMRCHRVP